MKYIDILKPIAGSSFEVWKGVLHEYNFTRDIVDLLDGVPNGTFYHPEFCTLCHTYNVCRAIYDGTGSDLLLEAAFLHDVGKSTHTNIGRDRIYGFGHADASARFVEKHKEHVTEFDLTYRIVKHHMDYSDWRSPKLQYDIPLKFFTYADKVKSRELYLADASKFELFLNRQKEKMLYWKQQLARKKVILLIGISGSGKSTYINDHFDSRYVVCPDEIRRELGDINNMNNNNQVWKLTRERMHAALAKHGKTVLDATNVNKWLRIQFMAQFNGCRKEAIFFDTDVEVAINRVQADIERGVDRSNVPKTLSANNLNCSSNVNLFRLQRNSGGIGLVKVSLMGLRNVMAAFLALKCRVCFLL